MHTTPIQAANGTKVKTCFGRTTKPNHNEATIPCIERIKNLSFDDVKFIGPSYITPLLSFINSDEGLTSTMSVGCWWPWDVCTVQSGMGREPKVMPRDSDWIVNDHPQQGAPSRCESSLLETEKTLVGALWSWDTMYPFPCLESIDAHGFTMIDWFLTDLVPIRWWIICSKGRHCWVWPSFEGS